MRPLTLSAEGYKALTRRTRWPRMVHALAHRASLALACAGSGHHAAMGAHLGPTKQTVAEWRAREGWP